MNKKTQNPKSSLYSLLHIDRKYAHRNINLETSASSSIDVYIKCGQLLAKSCKYFQIPYAVITNEPEFLRKKVESLGGGMEILGMEFSREVPLNASFYSAHFKLDLLREFGLGHFGEYIGLIDLDVVLTKPIHLDLMAKKNALFLYDIYDQEVSAYGEEVIKESMKKLDINSEYVLSWYGGEFIFGNKDIFKLLSNEIENIWPKYQNVYHLLHHVGDEMIVNAAISSLRKGAVLRLVNCGLGTNINKVPLIARWWSARTRSRQVSFSEVSEAAFLHLPADKLFLANISRKAFSPINFFNAYRYYIIRKIIIRKILNPFINIYKKEIKYVGNIK